MKNFLSRHDVPRILLSIALAVLLWCFVIIEDEPVKRPIFHNIPLTLTGTEVLEENNLMITEGDDIKLSIRVTGKFMEVAGFDESLIRAQTDVSEFLEPGTYSIPLDDISVDLGKGNAGQSINSEIVLPSSIKIVVDEVVSQEIPVSLNLTGEPAEGYVVDDVKLPIDKVVVSGPASIVQEIKYATGTVSVDGLAATQAAPVALAFYDANDELVESEDLSCIPNEITVNVPVMKKVSVPLTVELVNSAGLTSDMVDVTINPPSIEVYGEPAVVSKLTEISLGKIVLGAVDLSEPKTIGIELPDGVWRVDGQPSTAQVSIKVDGLITREIQVSDIELSNTGTDENLSVQLDTDSITVQIQGEASAVNNLTAEDIKVRAVFNADELGVGTHSVGVEIQPYGIAHFSVLNENPQVTITITNAGEPAPDGEPDGGEEQPPAESQPESTPEETITE